jgi:threonylcarbamoyladenosine tRNA methylthiotransferase CDKAL1
MKFYLETYGCTANLGNSRDLEEALVQKGHIPTRAEEADILIVNTCAVTEKTERKILRRLHQLQGHRLIIAGCLPVALPSSIEDIKSRKTLGILSKFSAQEIASMYQEDQNSNFRYVFDGHVRQDLCGIVNIAEGCVGVCSYCIVKKARGQLISRDPVEIVESVKRLVKLGLVEIQLTAQDTAAYGMDIGASLLELLELINELPGEFKVRVGMMNPDTIQPIMEELMAVYRNRRIYKFIHLPVQSGSDRILDGMDRNYLAKDFRGIVKFLKENFPEMGLVTDVIVGFPGEEEEDFAETVRIIEETRPDKVNITRYSKRPGTFAAELYDMPERIKKDRSRTITRMWLGIASERNRRILGRCLEVLVTERGKGSSMKARTENYTDVVIPGAPALGSLQRVRITEANSFYLTGELSTSSK